MGAYSNLIKIINTDIGQFAKKHGYSQSNILILQGKQQELKTRFPEVYNNLLSCVHNRDMRTPFQYGQDLVASWLFEDHIISLLNDYGIKADLAGADRNREILPTSRVSTTSDTVLEIGYKKIQMELMSDYTGYWKRTHTIDLRDDKYTRLLRESALFLGISTIDNSYVLLDFAKPLNYTYKKYHKFYGGKPCYTININENDLKKFSGENLLNDIKNKLN